MDATKNKQKDKSLVNNKHHFLIEHSSGITELLPIKSKEVLNIVTVLEHIRLELKFEEEIEPAAIFDMLKNFISAMCTENQNEIHDNIVTTTLKNIIEFNLKTINNETEKTTEKKFYEENLLNSPSIVNDLAGKLISFCRLLKTNLQKPTDNVYVIDEMFLWDKTLLNILNAIGEEGKKTSKVLEKESKKRYKLYLETKQPSLSLWLNLNSSEKNPIYLSPALQLLLKVAWEEDLRKKVDFGKNNPAGVTTTFFPEIKNMVSVGNTIQKTNSQIRMYNNGHLIG
ncbi:MAG TPA: hypothetical protein VKR53_01585, partial [Puia sp.]|nr:hypothetical protein [Puia sp.]